MPIYEYHCQKCGIIEITRKITDKALSRCPKCKGKIKKLISHTSFQLKGTGWYATDYARKDSKDTGPTEKKAPTTESKSDSQPAAEKSSSEKKTSKPAASGSSAD